MKIDLFETEDGQSLKFYINSNDQIFIEISDGSNDIMNAQFITLDKSDALEFAKALTKLAKSITE